MLASLNISSSFFKVCEKKAYKKTVKFVSSDFVETTTKKKFPPSNKRSFKFDLFFTENAIFNDLRELCNIKFNFLESCRRWLNQDKILLKKIVSKQFIVLNSQ